MKKVKIRVTKRETALKIQRSGSYGHLEIK